MNAQTERFETIEIANLDTVTGGEGRLIYQGPTENGNFINCEPVAGGGMSCGEFKDGQQAPLRTFQLRPYLY